MPTWGWVVVGIAGFVAIVVGLAMLLVEQRRTTRLRGRFGPEYERAVHTEGGRREAEAQLRDREQRRSHMNIRPLTSDSRRSYEQEWRQVQTRFVDDPIMAVGDADRLIQRVMSEEGYPMEDFDQRAEDLSVDHPRVVENYREGHKLALTSGQHGSQGTEELRQAMQHYRNLFRDLVEVTYSNGGGHEQDGASASAVHDGTMR